MRSRLLLAALLICGTALADVPTNLRINAVLTPSGKIDTRYRDGDDGSAEIPLTWSTIDSISVLTTDSGSINLCASYLTQPGGPNADLTVASGYSLPTDFSLGGTNNCTLSWSTPPAVNTTVRIDATRSAFTSRSGEFSIIVTAPPSSDTTAPTMPVKVQFTASATGGTLSWDASTDQRATLAGEAPSGVKEYDVQLNGVTIATVAAVSDSVYQYTCTNVGSSTPSPSGTQTGAAFALSAGGAGNQGTNWQFYYCSTPITGPFTASVKIDSVTAVSPTPDSFSTVALHFNESSDVGAKFLQCGRQFTDGSFQCKSKVTTGGSASNKATSASSFLADGTTIRVKLTDTGTWSAESCPDGNTCTSLYSVDSAGFSLPTTLNAGLSIFSRVNGSAVSANVSNLSITTAPRLTYEYTGAGGSFRVRARDNSLNVSSLTTAVTGAPITPPSDARKWNPGMYITTDQRSPGSGYTCTQYEILNGNPRWKGAQERIWWADMETSRGVYNFSMIGTLANCLSAMNKRLVIQVMDRRFHTTSYTGALPAYLTSESGTNCIWQGTATNGSPRTMLRFWYSQCMDREIALYTALYNHIKDMANVEMVATEEMALGLEENSVDGNPVRGGATGYSRANHVAQWKRWADTIGPIYVKTGICHYINGPSGLVDEVQATARSNEFGIGGPDIIPNQDPVYSYSILTGSANRIISPFGPVPNVTTHVDSRGKVPVCFAVQRPSLGGKEGNFTPAQLLTFANGTLHSTHIWFVRHLVANQLEDPENPGTYLDTTWYDMDDYLEAGNSITHTTCPTTWTDGCVTGAF